jgi:GT2 family glycosyltransferase
VPLPGNGPVLSIVMVAFRNDFADVASIFAALLEASDSIGLKAAGTLVVNDGSLAPPMDRVEVIQGHGNIGFAAGVKAGVDFEESDFVIIVNPDCLPDVDAFSTLLRRLEVGMGVVTPVLIGRDGEVDYAPFEDYVFTPAMYLSAAVCKWYLRRGKSNRIPPLVKIPGAFIAMETLVARELGGPFDPEFFLYGEDRDLTRRLRKAGIRMRLLRETRIVHLGGESGKSVSELVARSRADSALRIAERRYGSVGKLIMTIDLIAVGFLKSNKYGPELLDAAKWAVARWRGTRVAPPLDETALSSGMVSRNRLQTHFMGKEIDNGKRY